MDKWIDTFQKNRTSQFIVLGLFILVSSASVYFLERSVTAFLLLLGSLLLLHYTHLTNRTKWIVGLLLLVVIIPLATSGGTSQQDYMEVAVQTGIYVAMALGLNIVVGFAGLLDLGFVAFFAIGAYTYGIFASPQATQLFHSDFFPLAGTWFWPFILIGGFMAAIFGILLGIPVLRVKGDYLAIVTLGFGEIIRIVFNNMDKPVNITNGAQGLSQIQQPEIFGFTFSLASQFYYIVIVILLVIIIGVQRLEHSKLGRSWKAIREDEIAAQSMGIPLVKTKLWAFALGASFSGMMGVVFSAKNMFVDPSSFTLIESITILVMVILGGMGSIPGVILGAAVISVLNLQILTEVTNFLTQNISIPDTLSPTKMQRLIFGVILVLIAVYRPKGLITAKAKQYDPAKLAEQPISDK
ncbi:branched-chain amino acid ABC transporter permease [Shimazuella kribbensis]|uniref:branched-chain amino acid ABC transporter permease n=1 Tax=Shimazuella kribbensis TaxID=139808 RepID=UPI0003FD6584|nr:branched-chain amino acid ABC transporter permease [Shimazuella kribbensis]